MKAKELIKILELYPEFEIEMVFSEENKDHWSQAVKHIKQFNPEIVSSEKVIAFNVKTIKYNISDFIKRQ